MVDIEIKWMEAKRRSWIQGEREWKKEMARVIEEKSTGKFWNQYDADYWSFRMYHLSVDIINH